MDYSSSGESDYDSEDEEILYEEEEIRKINVINKQKSRISIIHNRKKYHNNASMASHAQSKQV